MTDKKKCIICFGGIDNNDHIRDDWEYLTNHHLKNNSEKWSKINRKDTNFYGEGFHAAAIQDQVFVVDHVRD